MVVGLLGILKAGGAFVPVDPDHPVAWLKAILEEAAPPVILTEQRWSSQLPSTDAKVVCMDSDWPSMNGAPVFDHTDAVRGENLAYMMFTSGSTGRPKGVQIEHHSLFNLLTSMQQHLTLGQK